VLGAWFDKVEGDIKSRSQAKGHHGEETVVIVSAASRSLAESDFYRLAEQGKHVAGWAGGITKVVQSVSAVTREPRGQYFIFFDSRTAAKAYHARLIAMLRQTRSADALFSPLSSGVDSPSRDEAADLGEEEEEASTASPSVDSPSPDVPPAPTGFPPFELRDKPQIMSVASLASTLAEAAVSDNTNPNNSGKWKQPPSSTTTTVPHQLEAHLHTGPDSAPTPGAPVLVRLVGSRITLSTMHEFLRADGWERNQAWKLIDSSPPNPKNGRVSRHDHPHPHRPRPVEPLRAGSAELKDPVFSFFAGGGSGSRYIDERIDEWEEGGDYALGSGGRGRRGERPQVGYTRFVITFEDAFEARRFARTWHKREMMDERTGRMMVVNTALLI
jgi:hypothetical protein